MVRLLSGAGVQLNLNLNLFKLMKYLFRKECQTKHNCPGHFGSIRLTEPVYHISWVPHLLRQLKKFEGKYTWDKHKSSIMKDNFL